MVEDVEHSNCSYRASLGVGDFPSQPPTAGFLAIIMPDADTFESVKGSLVSAEEYCELRKGASQR